MLFKSTLWIICVVALFEIVSAQPQPEFAVTCDEVFDLTGGLPIRYGSYARECAISPTGDLDRFRLAGIAGDRIRVSLLKYTGCFDPVLELRDPNGILVPLPPPSSCNGGPVCSPYCSCPSCSLIVDLTLTITGTYTFYVSESGSDETGDYLFGIERIPPVFCEPDLPYATFLDDNVNPTTDLDFIRFQGSSGTQIRLTVSKPVADCFDPVIQLLDPDGQDVSLTTTSCSGGPTCSPYCSCRTCSITNDLALTKSGTYVLLLRDSGSDEVGNYRVSLDCIFGACPLGLYVHNLKFVDRSCMTWDFAQDFEACYDIVKGGLSALHASAGNFATAVTECLVAGECDNTRCDGQQPPGGSAFFYLIRGVSATEGSYDDSWGPAQRCGRDVSIESAPMACP